MVCPADCSPQPMGVPQRQLEDARLGMVAWSLAREPGWFSPARVVTINVERTKVALRAGDATAQRRPLSPLWPRNRKSPRRSEGSRGLGFRRGTHRDSVRGLGQPPLDRGPKGATRSQSGQDYPPYGPARRRHGDAAPERALPLGEE